MKRILRTGPAAGALLCLLGLCMVGEVPAGAATTVKVSDVVNAQTTLAKLKQTVVIPTGTFVGGVNFYNGKLKGNLKLPPATTTVTLVGIGLANATFTIVPTKAVTGTFNFNNYRVRATSTFNIHVDSVTPVGVDVNLVRSSCVTSTPVTLAFSGTTPPFGPGTVRGTYTIPNLQDCGAITAVLNAVMAGAGNTFTAVMSPYS